MFFPNLRLLLHFLLFLFLFFWIILNIIALFGIPIFLVLLLSSLSLELLSQILLLLSSETFHIRVPYFPFFVFIIFFVLVNCFDWFRKGACDLHVQTFDIV